MTTINLNKTLIYLLDKYAPLKINQQERRELTGLKRVPFFIKKYFEAKRDCIEKLEIRIL